MDLKNLNLKKYKSELLFIPLGGSNEIGLNCNLYHYNGKWLIVDCGIGFVKSIPGVDVMVPDVSFFNRYRDNIVGMFITHIHEDHLGAIQYIWNNLRFPIYASKFTKTFLLDKFKDTEYFNELEVIEVNEGDRFTLAPFEIECLNLTHSTPEMNALIIKTAKGNILHTGDWKFDTNPVIGNKSNIKRLKELGKKKEILAVVCDSTNIFNEGDSQSESELFQSFYNIVKERSGMVVCATFASNLSRLKTIADVAKKTRRKVVLFGNALRRVVRVAKEVGYFNEGYEFLADDEIKNYKRRNLIVIATGCQGEFNSGLDKLASDSSRTLNLKAEDTVIFSSRVIPGNERDILAICNKLAEKDVEVITEKTHFVHVSGHYSRNDLLALYDYVKPKISIAVHGEMMQLQEHQRVATGCGVKYAVKAQNSLLMRLSNDGVEKIASINIENMAVDGKRLLPFKDGILRQRRKMEEAGVFFVNLVINSKYKLLTNPVISAPGGYDFARDRAMREILLEDIVGAYNKALRQIMDSKSKKKFNTDEEKDKYIEQQVRTAVNKIYDVDLGKKPVVEVLFTKIATKEKQKVEE